jgi:MFS family permease
MFLTSIGFGIILPSLPFFAEKLGATSFEMGLAMSAFAMSQIFASSIWGSLSDRIGRKPVLIIGVVGYGCISALVPFSPNVPVLLVLRFFGGIMTSAVMPSSMALLTEHTPPEHRPRVIGYMGSINSIGFILGPPAGSFLGLFGIEVPFVSVGLLAILNGLLAWRLLPGKGMSIEEEKKPRPVLRQSLLQRFKFSFLNPGIAPLMLGTFVLNLVDSSISVTIAFLITGPLNSTELMTGFAFMINAAFSAIVQSVVFARTFHRLGDVMTIIVGFSFSSLGYFLLGSTRDIAGAFVGLAILSMGRGFAFPAVSSGISLRMPMELMGSAFGAQSTVGSIARTIGPLIAGSLFLKFQQYSYFFSTGLLLLTIAISLIWRRRMGKLATDSSQPAPMHNQSQSRGETM